MDKQDTIHVDLNGLIDAGLAERKTLKK